MKILNTKLNTLKRLTTLLLRTFHCGSAQLDNRQLDPVRSWRKALEDRQATARLEERALSSSRFSQSREILVGKRHGDRLQDLVVLQHVLALPTFGEDQLAHHSVDLSVFFDAHFINDRIYVKR